MSMVDYRPAIWMHQRLQTRANNIEHRSQILHAAIHEQVHKAQEGRLISGNNARKVCLVHAQDNLCSAA